MASRKTSSAFGFLLITKNHSVLLHVMVEYENCTAFILTPVPCILYYLQFDQQMHNYITYNYE